MELDEAFLEASDIDISIETCTTDKAWIKRTLYMNLLPIFGPTTVIFKNFYFFVF